MNDCVEIIEEKKKRRGDEEGPKKEKRGANKLFRKTRDHFTICVYVYSV